MIRWLLPFFLPICCLCYLTHFSQKIATNHHRHYSSISLISKDQAEEIKSLKFEILQLAASLDRGQAYNPTSGEYYGKKNQYAKDKVLQLINKSQNKVPKNISELDGEWELVYTSVPHGIFRSSPFFLAIQEAYKLGGEEDKAELFFKLHELQTCSWGISKVGRIGQTINSTTKTYISEFDTSIFSLTVIPILGWFKLLPTFGGRVITVSKIKNKDNEMINGLIELEVDYTTSKPVEGLSGLGSLVWNIKVPVGFIWKLLPWNKGRAATCNIMVRYLDENFRIMEDSGSELFVYTKPIYIE